MDSQLYSLPLIDYYVPLYLYNVNVLGGRVHITSISTYYLLKAIVIAIRYSAVRKQFADENAIEETPVLEYQQQVRPLYDITISNIYSGLL